MQPGKRLTNEEVYKLSKIRLDWDHTKGSSKEAMVEGCYQILYIQELPPKTSFDIPNLYVATAKYKANLTSEFDGFEVFIRLNPLVNLDAKGNFRDWAKKNKIFPSKSLPFFESLGDRIINVKKIHLGLDTYFESDRYIYEWDVEE